MQARDSTERVNLRSVSFMETIIYVLSSAEWERRLPQDPEGRTGVIIAGKAGLTIDSGIIVERAITAPEFAAAMTALVEGLVAEGIPVTANVFKAGGDPTAIHMLLGSIE